MVSSRYGQALMSALGRRLTRQLWVGSGHSRAAAHFAVFPRKGIRVRGLKALFAATLIVSISTAGAVPKRPQASSQDHRTERLRLTQSGGGLGFDVQETVVFSRSRGDDWFLERHRTEINCGLAPAATCPPTSVHDWVSTQNCPALRQVMTALPSAQEASLAIMRERARRHLFIQVTDTPLLSLETLPHSKIEPQSEWEGPLVEWWRSAEQRLKPCWTAYSG